MTFLVHHTDTAGGTRLVGALEFITSSIGALLATEFTYDPAWLADGFALGPDLPLIRGVNVFGGERILPGAIEDAGPDQWGRTILREKRTRAWRRLAKLENGRSPMPAPLHAGDFVTLVGDTGRQGALRLSDQTEPETFLAEEAQRVPAVADVLRLREAAQRFTDHEATDGDLDLLLRAGTTPGGARPKAVVTKIDGTLALAKFPHGTDRWDVLAWEATALTLASRAGIPAPAIELLRLDAGSSILLLDRFDRVGVLGRRGYLSARSLTQKTDAETISYVELAARQRRFSAAPEADSEDLVRRIALTLLVNNVDDHLRNHGYLRERQGWRLSPVFDVNPWPLEASFDSTPLSRGSSPVDRSLGELVDQAKGFGLTKDRVRALVLEVFAATQTWREVAGQFIVDQEDLGYLERALENSATAEARAMVASHIDS